MRQNVLFDRWITLVYVMALMIGCIWHGLDALQGTRAKPGNHLVLYKIINSIVAIHILNHASKPTRPTRSNQTNNFIPISTRTSYHKASFFPSTIPMWNSLAESFKTSTSVAQFRTGLYNSYQLNQSAI